jgi:hypothetical protein
MVPRFAVTLISITSELAGLCPGTAQGLTNSLDQTVGVPDFRLRSFTDRG